MPIGAVAGAALGSVAASAAGSLISGAMQSGSINGGASQASGISQQAIADANTNRLADRQNYQPFLDSGTSATTQQSNLLGLNGQDAANSAMSTFQASPGYQYNVSQGLRVVDSGAAANGMLRSGATLKAEQTLGNNLADQDFGNYFNRLNSLSTTGLQAAQGQANTTATYNNLLSGQATNQEQIATGAASQNASIDGNVASGLTSAIKSTNWNSLLGNGTTGTSFGTNGGTDTSAFDGAGVAF